MSSDDASYVRCSTCNTKLAEHLNGSAVFTCRRCHQLIYIDTGYSKDRNLRILTDKQENGTVSAPHPM
jgi:DNA-directed RNA polymerase subunit RPC12/RpoP